MQLPQLPADKANHFVYGAVLALVGSLISPAVGFGLCLVFAAGKEVRDKVTGSGNPEFMDFVATLAGGFAVLAPQLAPQLVAALLALN